MRGTVIHAEGRSGQVLQPTRLLMERLRRRDAKCVTINHYHPCQRVVQLASACLQYA